MIEEVPVFAAWDDINSRIKQIGDRYLLLVN
jgi:hypothetical protein